LNLLHNEEAGPRRIAANAGCDGRSLARTTARIILMPW
jgi:hypothetical protein